MRITVTGGTGFIGGPLVDRLLKAGHEVCVWTRHPQRAKWPKGVTAQAFDALSPSTVPSLEGYDAVFHLAGETISERWTEERKDRVLRSRTEGTAAVARAAAAAKVKALISSSAVGYYGEAGGAPLDESAPPGNDFLAAVCRQWEEATHFAADAGVRVAMVRTGVVLHPEGGALAKMLTPFKLGAGGRLGSGDQYMSWIHREDLLRLYQFALDTKTIKGPVNGTAPEPVTNREFTRALGHALHRPTLFPAPAFALKLAFGEMAQMLLTGQKVIPKRAQEAGFKFNFPTIDAAFGDLFGQRAA
jgi:uncharacterized protein (TIGR01777 family)